MSQKPARQSFQSSGCRARAQRVARRVRGCCRGPASQCRRRRHAPAPMSSFRLVNLNAWIGIFDHAHCISVVEVSKHNLHRASGGRQGALVLSMKQDARRNGLGPKTNLDLRSTPMRAEAIVHVAHQALNQILGRSRQLHLQPLTLSAELWFKAGSVYMRPPRHESYSCWVQMASATAPATLTNALLQHLKSFGL